MKIFNFVKTIDGQRKLYFFNKKILSYKVPCKYRDLFERRFESNLLSGDRQKNLDVYYSDYMSDKKDLNKLLNLICIESLTQNTY